LLSIHYFYKTLHGKQLNCTSVIAPSLVLCAKFEKKKEINNLQFESHEYGFCFGSYKTELN